MNNKSKSINYTRIIVIAHGKCEKIAVSFFKRTLRLPIGIESRNNGNNSIQVDGLLSILGNTIFKNKNSLLNNYEIEKDTKGKLKNFYIMPIMDLDDTKNMEEYKNKKMFQNHWLYPYIYPIWNIKNFDEVLLSIGLIKKLPSDKEKVSVYSKVFSSQNSNNLNDLELIEDMLKKFKKSNKTNFDLFIQECINWTKKQNE